MRLRDLIGYLVDWLLAGYERKIFEAENVLETAERRQKEIEAEEIERRNYKPSRDRLFVTSEMKSCLLENRKDD